MVYKSLDNKKLSPFYHLSVVLHESDTSAVSFMTLILDNSVATVMRCYRAFHKHAILKFKSQLTIAFFAAVNHLNGPLRKQNFTLTGSKGHGL